MSALLFPIVPNPHKSVTHEIGKHLASVGLDNKHLQGNVCSPLQRYKPAAMLWGNLRLGPQPRSNILERLQDIKPKDEWNDEQIIPQKFDPYLHRTISSLEQWEVRAFISSSLIFFFLPFPLSSIQSFGVEPLSLLRDHAPFHIF